MDLMTTIPPQDRWVDSVDHRIVLRDLTWAQYEQIRDIVFERSGVRLSYLDGVLELMSPSIGHEGIKKFLARLLECHAEERGWVFQGYGSWTLENEPRKCAVEPDECYVLDLQNREVPDIAIEVEWSHHNPGKLEIYRRLGVREVWRWAGGTIVVHRLRDGGYEEIRPSALLPEVDLDLLAQLVTEEDQTATVRRYRSRLRSS